MCTGLASKIAKRGIISARRSSSYAILLCLKSTHRYQFYGIHIIVMVILHVMEALWRVQYREVEVYGRYYWDVHTKVDGTEPAVIPSACLIFIYHLCIIWLSCSIGTITSRVIMITMGVTIIISSFSSSFFSRNTAYCRGEIQVSGTDVTVWLRLWPWMTRWWQPDPKLSAMPPSLSERDGRSCCCLQWSGSSFSLTLLLISTAFVYLTLVRRAHKLVTSHYSTINWLFDWFQLTWGVSSAILEAQNRFTWPHLKNFNAIPDWLNSLLI